MNAQDYDDIIEATSAYCPICDNPGGFMGQLGNLLWFRCISCGMEFNHKASE